jgi:hypothetical protein
MKMQKCPHCSEENKIYARVCSYCMKTIGVEHKVKMSSVGNWVIVFIVVVLYYRLLNEQHRRITNYTTIKT